MSAPSPAPAFDADSLVMPLRWNDALGCGLPVIDRQHQHLFELGNQVVTAVKARASRETVQTLLQTLIQHIEDHFITEEALMTRQGHPLVQEHQQAHDALRLKARDLQRHYHAGLAQAGDIVSFITYDVILSHIVKEDLKYMSGADGEAR